MDDLLHGLDLRAHDVRAPQGQETSRHVKLFAVGDLAQLLAVRPDTGRALGGELG